MQLNEVHVEYMDAIQLSQFYREQMSSICKDYLDKVGFIIQAIRIEQMKLQFIRENHQIIDLNLKKVEEILDISSDIDWKIEQNSTLVIDTPKYLGYQLGTLKRDDDGLALYRATKTYNDRFIFESMDLFTSNFKTRKASGEESEKAEFLVPFKDLSSVSFPYDFL